MPRRRFELVAGKAAKFWEINQHGRTTEICFGRLGTNGQTKTKEHDTPADAKAAAATLIAQKTKKGYVEVGAGKSAGSSKSKKPAQRTTSDAVTIDSAAAIPKDETLSFVGLVDPSGGGAGIRMGRAKHWTFAAKLCAWRADKGPLVREPLDVIMEKIGQRKVASLMKQFPSWRIVRFTARRVPQKSRLNVSVALVAHQGDERDKELAAVKRELEKPVEIQDRTFGTIRLNPELELFEGKLTHRGEDLYLCFETASMDEVLQMIKLAKPLWRARTKWFREFEDIAVERLLDVCQNWWIDAEENEDGKPLTEALFRRFLGCPCGLIFRLEGEELHYEMCGASDALFGEHGMTASGNLRDGLLDAEFE